MSEIPNLKLCESVFVENIGNKDEINFVVNNHNKEYIITLSSLKEVNAFYDKYKDSLYDFIKEYPQHLELFYDLGILYYKRIPEIDEELIKCDFNKFKEWLHDYLYKVSD